MLFLFFSHFWLSAVASSVQNRETLSSGLDCSSVISAEYFTILGNRNLLVGIFLKRLKCRQICNRDERKPTEPIFHH